MGNYQNYLDSLQALYSGEGSKFKNQAELAKHVHLASAQIKKYSGRESTKNVEKFCAFLDKLGAQIVFPGDELDGFVLVPRVEAVAGAGESWEVDDTVVGMYAFRDSFMKYIGVNPKQAIMMNVRGDSMTPLIADKDTVLIDKADNNPREGFIYVLSLGDTLMVKRLQRIMNGWNICSENKNYPPIPVQGQEVEQMRIIGRVRWFGRVV